MWPNKTWDIAQLFCSQKTTGLFKKNQQIKKDVFEKHAQLCIQNILVASTISNRYVRFGKSELYRSPVTWTNYVQTYCKVRFVCLQGDNFCTVAICLSAGGKLSVCTFYKSVVLGRTHLHVYFSKNILFLQLFLTFSFVVYATACTKAYSVAVLTKLLFWFQLSFYAVFVHDVGVI